MEFDGEWRVRFWWWSRSGSGSRYFWKSGVAQGTIIRYTVKALTGQVIMWEVL